MNLTHFATNGWLVRGDNDVDALIPEVWAEEALMQLYNNLVVANLFHQDFSDEVARYGDVVHTRRPGTFTTKRKTNADNVTDQDAILTDVEVRLNQWHHISFIIKDGEESQSMQSLIDIFLRPGIEGIAQGIDQMVAGEFYNFIGNSAGKLGTAPTKTTVLDLREQLTSQKAPLDGRFAILTPSAESDLLDITDFTTADKVADGGAAMRAAELGQRFGFNFYMAQNAPAVNSGLTTYLAAVNNGTMTVGSTAITYDASSDAGSYVGSWITIAGDLTPQRVTADSGTVLTITPGLKHAVVNDAVITIYPKTTVNNSPSGYAANYVKDVVVDALGSAPAVSQLVSAGSAYYGLMQSPTTPSTTALTLNRGLDAAVADGDTLGIGPNGQFSFAGHRNAIGLVTRPLAAPRAGTGALSYVGSYNGLSIRVTITYDGQAQGHRVVLDLLAGVKTLDTRLGALLYS